MEKKEPTIGVHVAGRAEDDTVHNQGIDDEASYEGAVEARQIDSMSFLIVVVKFGTLDHVDADKRDKAEGNSKMYDKKR